MIKVNFLPYREYRRHSFLKRMYFFLFVGLLISIGFGYLMKRAAEYYLSDTVQVTNILTEQIKLQEGTFRKMKEVKKEIKFYEDKLKDFESIVSRRYNTIILLKDLIKLVPDDTFLKNFSVKDRDIVIEGYASNNNAVSILIERMNLSNVIKFVSLKKINSVEVGGRVFQHFDISANSLL